MKTKNKENRTTGAPPTSNTGLLQSEEALIRFLLDKAGGWTQSRPRPPRPHNTRRS